jgi:DNA mismatch repair protein MutS
MSETGYILHHATERSLVVLDEVGRGTSTYDGLSIAWAVAEALHDRGTRTLFATHFHELTQLAEHLDAARNHTLAVTERGQQVIFLRQLVPGGAEKSFGIQVARLAGLPEHVVSRAQQILDQLEQDQSVAQPTLKSLPQQPVLEPQPEESAHAPEANNGVLEKLAHDIHSLDIANMTPVQALVTLNDLQARLAHPDKEPPICSENPKTASQV